MQSNEVTLKELFAQADEILPSESGVAAELERAIAEVAELINQIEGEE